MNMRILFAVACFLFGNLSFSQTLVLKYTSTIDYNPSATTQYGQAYYLGPSFVGLKICSSEGYPPYTSNIKSRFVVFDLKGNTKWTWDASYYGVADFYVEPSPTGSFWIRSYYGDDPNGMLMIYDKKRKTWSESSIGQGDPVNFLAMGTPNITSGLCTVTKNESGVLTFYVYKY